MAIDSTRLLFSTSFKITDKISVRHATLGDVIDLGEEEYFRIVQTLTAIPSDEKWLLFQQGIDWMEISDLEFFYMLVCNMPKEQSEIFLPGLDFSKFKLYKKPDGDIICADKDRGIVIDSYGYARISEALCTIHKIKKKPEKAGNAVTKQLLIEDDKERHKIAQKSNKEFKSALMPLISSMVNRDGFKYDYSSIRNMLFGQFMDAVARLQLIVSTDQLIAGVYAGNIDTKKLDKKKLDWTREI